MPIPIMDPELPPCALTPFKLLLTAWSFLLEPPLVKNPLKKDFLEIPLRTPVETPEEALPRWSFSSTRPVDAFPLPRKLDCKEVSEINGSKNLLMVKFDYSLSVTQFA